MLHGNKYFFHNLINLLFVLYDENLHVRRIKIRMYIVNKISWIGSEIGSLMRVVISFALGDKKRWDTCMMFIHLLDIINVLGMTKFASK